MSDPAARFGTKYIVDESGCWLWTAFIDKFGYGMFRWNGKMGRAHRYAYEQAAGTIPAGLVIDHKCITPRCVNPAHLQAVTQAENNRLAAQRAIKSTHCKNGHLFTPENTITRASKGWRRCRECKRKYECDWHLKRKSLTDAEG